MRREPLRAVPAALRTGAQATRRELLRAVRIVAGALVFGARAGNVTFCAVVASALLLATVTSPRATEAPRLHAGAIEIGAAGSLTVVESDLQSTLALRCGTFASAPAGLWGFEVEVAHSHVHDLDNLDASLAASWSARLQSAAAVPYAGIAAGWRHEWVGSFDQARFPVGVDIGVRLLPNTRAGVRLEYRLRRVLNDPVADYFEQRFLFGLSLYFRNDR